MAHAASCCLSQAGRLSSFSLSSLVAWGLVPDSSSMYRICSSCLQGKLCKEHGILRYPTIMFGPPRSFLSDPEARPVQYGGTRGLEDLLAFVGDQTGTCVSCPTVAIYHCCVYVMHVDWLHPRIHL